jgi:hypothetical protein
MVTNGSEKAAVSVFFPEGGTSMFLRSLDTRVSPSVVRQYQQCVTRGVW